MPPRKKSSKKKKKAVKGQISSNAEVILVHVTPEEIATYLTTDLQLPKEHLSPSAIGMYLRCPFQYFKRYVEGKKRPPGVSMAEGTSHHATCEFNSLKKRKTGKDRSEKQVIEHFCDHFHDNRKEIGDWEGMKERDILLRGKKLQKAYINNFAPRFKPHLIEHEFVLMVGPVKILCYMDAAGTLTPILKKKPEKNIVCDYKTASRSKSDKELEHSFQLSTYGVCEMANRSTRDDFPDVGFCIFKKIKIPVIEWQSVKFNASRMKWFVITTLSVANAISRGSFPVCDPVYNFLCSPQWCGYWDECLGACNKLSKRRV
ncbi:PD-(D/E)XK nuclease family protein [Candidatus Pacearchaeota archaeon]|nr:PD-(D/E)XK nuclease family protein [Candidatus Pacearchaeota archaeon]